MSPKGRRVWAAATGASAVASVMATKLFGERFPEWFGSIAESAYTLFQVMTLESWSMGIARPVLEVYPYAWAFFIPFILIATFTMLNLFIAVIVNAIQSEQARAHEGEEGVADASPAAAPEDPTAALRAEVGALRTEIAALRMLLERGTR